MLAYTNRTITSDKTLNIRPARPNMKAFSLYLCQILGVSHNFAPPSAIIVGIYEHRELILLPKSKN